MDKQIDPKGLIGESFRMEGLGEAECRSIFLDWALSLPQGVSPANAARILARRHANEPTHPMTAILREASRATTMPRRRGGRQARLRARDRG